MYTYNQPFLVSSLSLSSGWILFNLIDFNGWWWTISRCCENDLTDVLIVVFVVIVCPVINSAAALEANIEIGTINASNQWTFHYFFALIT